MKNLLYIGLNGYAGSGKDTVAKALRLMFSEDFKRYEDFRERWDEANKYNYATLGQNIQGDWSKCICIAFADQLKYICSSMFSIPVEKFYYNKETAWVNISGDFSYTEYHPIGQIMTAEEYYYLINSSSSNTYSKDIFMSLRELLVYIGTYVMQSAVNKNIFINGVNSTINRMASRNNNLQYVICTDVRFMNEFNYIKEKHGVNINIVRSDVKQLNNIAEHELDGIDEFDFTLYNDGTYDDLLKNLWDLVNDNIVFKNITNSLNEFNYIRKIDDDVWQTCLSDDIIRIAKENGEITRLDLSSGTIIEIGKEINNDTFIKSIKLQDSGFDYELGT